MGEVLLWSLKYALGKTVYTAAIHKVWVKIYCRMLKTIMPLAVAMEVQQIPLKNPENNPELRAGVTLAEESVPVAVSKPDNQIEELKCEHLRTASSV